VSRFASDEDEVLRAQHLEGYVGREEDEESSKALDYQVRPKRAKRKLWELVSCWSNLSQDPEAVEPD